MRTIIGIVGYAASGKDTVARYLIRKYGFLHVATSDLIREYVRDHKLGQETRPLLMTTAIEMRNKGGADALVVAALNKPASRLAISGLCAVEEVRRIKSEGGFVIGLRAPVEMRYQWAKLRRSSKDHITFEQFVELEKIEAVAQVENAQDKKAVLAEADVLIENSGSLDDLYRRLDRELSKYILTADEKTKSCSV